MTDFKWRLKQYANAHGVFLYELADCLGISDTTLARKLRGDVPEEEQKKMFKLIDERAKEKADFV